MKKVLSIILTIALVATLACAASATEFVESVGAKDAPELIVALIKDATTGEVLEEVPVGHLLVTSVADAPTSTSIPAAARDALLMVYGKLSDGSMTLPAEKIRENLKDSDLQIRDLFDLSWICETGCHEEQVEPQNIVLEVVFKLGVEADAIIHTMTYKNGEWNPIVKTVNNGDGTITCTFEHLCPVVFAIDNSNVDTGDAMGNQMILWAVIMAVSAAALVTLVVLRRKKA